MEKLTTMLLIVVFSIGTLLVAQKCFQSIATTMDNRTMYIEQYKTVNQNR